MPTAKVKAAAIKDATCDSQLIREVMKPTVSILHMR
jgi:hypothetical protein